MASSSSGLEFDLHLEPRGGLIHQIDGLVGQEAVGDVALGQRRRRHQRRIRNAHAVVLLVLLLEPAQDRDGVLHRRLGDEHGLEAPRQGGVLLDVLAVLVERGGADAVQLAARQGGFEQVARVHGALGLAGADDGVQLVDEQDDAPALGLHLAEHGLEALLELAAVLGAGDQRAHVERQQALILEALRHVALDDALGEPFRDGGLADAGLADQHGIVLGAARQHLDGAADLLVAADDGVDLALGRGGGEIARIALQRVVALLGRGAVRGAALAQVVDGAVEGRGVDARLVQGAPRIGGGIHGERKQQALHGDELVAGLVGDLLGRVEGTRQLRREVDLAGAAARDLGAPGQRPLDRRKRIAGTASRALDDAGRQPLGVVEQHLEQVVGAELLVLLAQGQALGRLHEPLGTVGVYLEVHDIPPRHGRFAPGGHDNAVVRQESKADAAGDPERHPGRIVTQI